MADFLECDVAIAGGGMVGATLACILAQGGVRVGLFESREPERVWNKNSIDLRVSALTLSSQNIFEALNVWDSMVKSGVSPYRQMRVWDFEGEGELNFDGADAGLDIMGHIVENRGTVAALWKSLEQMPAVTVFCPARITDLQCYDDFAVLGLEDGGNIKTQLIVGADGRSSAIRNLAGIKVSGWPYRQDALVTTVSTSEGHRQTAYQRFLPTGPLAFLPLLNGDCSIVWSADTELTKKNLALDKEDFLHELEKASAGVLGKIEDCGKRVSFPLSLQFAKDYTGERVALVGDVIHAVHPLAGQGANLGLLDAAALGELILQAHNQQRPISSPHVLRRYERWRKGDNLAMLAALDVLKRTYGISFAPFNQTRALSMNLINKTLPLKNYFNRYAMGLRKDLPGLAYGKPCW